MFFCSRKSICISWLLSCLLLGVALLHSAQSQGAELPEQTPAQPGFFDPVDAPRDYLAGKFVGFASYVDQFFGEDRAFQESNNSVLQLDITRVVGRGAEQRFVFSGRAKVHLPNMEKRMHLLLETNPDKNVTGEQPQVKTTAIGQVAGPESYAAAARIENAVETRAHYSADAGIQFQGVNTRPFARGRGRYRVSLEQWQIELAETLFWFNNTGTGATTQLDFERRISEPKLFRASTNGTWLMNTQNFDLRQDLSVFHTMDERSAMLYQTSAIGISRPQWQVTEYVALVAYRYRLHREWMFIELSPQLHYPAATNYRVNPMLSLRLELLLEDPK
jgi:hypothetical protein